MNISVALPERSHLSHCLPEIASCDLQKIGASNNAENGTSAARDSYPHAVPEAASAAGGPARPDGIRRFLERWDVCPSFRIPNSEFLIPIELKLDRAVIASEHVGVNSRVDHPVFEVGRDDEVVDAPTHVAFADPGTVAPPGVGADGLGVSLAEDVDIAVVEQAGDPLPFLGEEPGVLLVGLGICEIDLLVGGVDVAADDDALALLPLRLGVLQNGL